VLGAFLVFFAIRDYFSIYATYGAFRESGITHADVWNFSKYPREMSLYLFQHLVVGIAAISVIVFISKNKFFPWVFLAYYICLVIVNIATGIIYNSPAGIGGVIGQTLLCVPWLIYVFKSKQVRNVFA
jgi:hypothetical protein